MSDLATPAIDWMRGHVAAGRLPTAVIGIATRDGVVDIAAAGSDDAGDAHVDSRYCLYSVTKPLSGLAAMRAVERGLLTTDTMLGSLVPEAASPQVTLGQLLSHTSGLADVVLGGGTTPYASLRDALLKAGLDYIPGTARRYNNIAWEGIAAMVEAVTDEPFAAQIERLARDAGATTLSFDDADARPVYDAEKFDHDHSALMALKHPAAGAVASIHDLLAIGQSLLTGDGALVKPATVEAMLRPRTRGLYVIDPHPAAVHDDFGLAFNLPRRPGLIDQSWYGHEGWTSTQLWVSPEAGVVLTLVTNRFAATARDAAVDVDQLRNLVTSALG